MRYTFGHTDNAAERLRNIAGFFNPLAIKFINPHLKKQVKTAADLGCGPGYTTKMLASVTRAGEVTGLDISDYFIILAQQQFPKLNFLKKDLTRWNPGKKYDILYCRFLLSHLVNLKSLLGNWIDHLNKDGMLFIDELEDIFTDVPVFCSYLEMNNILVKSQGAELYVGKKLDDEISGFNIYLNQSDIIPVKDSMAAGWFYPNTVGIWNEEQVVLNRLPVEQKKIISDDLLTLYRSPYQKSRITWKMKRIILTH